MDICSHTQCLPSSFFAAGIDDEDGIVEGDADDVEEKDAVAKTADDNDTEPGTDDDDEEEDEDEDADTNSFRPRK
jgi:hypothetical protein